ncbi:hypothetical protein DMC25_19665 [Caulobacter sp. D4A]|uniref:hypothetical protein n=1 Tax=unclassified Caulobacter TaxID=2648921 RepID=UPI000D737D9A|nr:MULTISPECIES: hypothetical protein [unclassified Caulobacter]PXA82671.1 hypothetical protein DMC25_19665 [Caulobacter sp. D4A]PXA96080.1 hypothetical protein DMC18_02550 [Caulobacter sp. D5]
MKHATRRALTASLFGLALAATAPAVALAGDAAPQQITEAEVLAAADAWGRGLVSISVAYNGKRENLPRAKAVASAFIDRAYGYNLGPVLFKPTLTTKPHVFRLTKEGALSYFVDDDPEYNDDGFALKEPWRRVVFKPVGIQINGAVASTMGTVELYVKGQDDKPAVVVDKTWVFKKDDKGVVRIIVHHSSLQFNGY